MMPSPMKETSLLETERGLLRDLLQLAADRAQAEAETEEQFQSRTERSQHKFDAAYQSIIIRFASQKEAQENEYREACQNIDDRLEAVRAKVDAAYREERRKVLERYKKEKESAKAALQEASWTLGTILEGNKNDAEEDWKEVQGRVGSRASQLEELQTDARKLLESWRFEPSSSATVNSPASASSANRNLQDFVVDAERQSKSIRKLILPRLLHGMWFYLMVLILVLAAAGLCFVQLGSQNWQWVAGISIGVLVLGLATKPLLHRLAHRQVERRYQPLCQTIADAEVSRVRALELAQSHLQTRIAQCQTPHDKALRRTQRKYKRQRVEN